MAMWIPLWFLGQAYLTYDAAATFCCVSANTSRPRNMLYLCSTCCTCSAHVKPVQQTSQWNRHQQTICTKGYVLITMMTMACS